MTAALPFYTIPPHLPFADVLARELLARAGGEPMALAQMRVLLPTRRAIRSLREAFLRLSEGRPLLLPHMQPVGEVDEEEMLLSGFPDGVEGELPPVMPASRRMLQLARLIHRYHQLEFGPAARMDQAVHLARELGALLDEVAREERDINTIEHLVEGDLAAHWKLTVDFLRIIMQQWPDILAQEGRIDPVTRRNLLMAALARQWTAHPPAYPVIAAGTTGSTPATARLLEVVARLPQGMVVLPAWDAQMPRAVWEALRPEKGETHPQYGMKRLLRELGLQAEDVKPLGGDVAPHPRVALLQEALRPAESTSAWRQVSLDWQAALAGFHRLDCATVQEEATAIALLLRDALQTPRKTAALVTPNRDLARRVAAVLRRFHVHIDDSGGIPLSDTPAGVLLHLLAGVAINRAAPVPLLALLKHPLALAGLPAGRCRHLARQVERQVLRGVRPAEGMESLAVELHEKKQQDSADFVERIASILAPFLRLMQADEVAFTALLRAHIAVAEALSADGAGEPMLWRGEEGEQLAGYLHEVLESAADMPLIDPAAYAGMLSALLAGKSWRPHYGLHPRLHILSPMEARLQLFDRVVLGGLNEGAWPADVGQDPWMSRPMRGKFGLPLPERQIGLAAHDFLSLAGAGEVFVTRAEKEGGSPSVPSRWLLRVEALLGVLGGDAARHAWAAGGAQWCGWAARLDAVADPAPCPAPMPAPPLAARPRELYVTSIETLLRNPYGIYAKKVLGLHRLDPLDQEPGASDFGNLVHDAIEQFAKNGGETLEEMVEYGRTSFGALLDRPGVRAFWWPRFLRIAEWVLEEESRRADEVAEVLAEQLGEMEWGAPAGPFSLKARIDRTEILADGRLRLIDHKTGALPAIADVQRGLAGQLLLEAAIAHHGTLGAASRRGSVVADAEYWHLRGGKEVAKVVSVAEEAQKKGETLEQWVEAAHAGVQALVAAYDDPATPYLHAPVAADAPRFDDYAHLARVKEWGAEA